MIKVLANKSCISILNLISLIFTENKIKIKHFGNDLGDYKNFKVKVNDGNWKFVKAKIVPNDRRFNLKCNIDGAISNVSIVIDGESVMLFGVVRYSINIEFLKNFYVYSLYFYFFLRMVKRNWIS